MERTRPELVRWITVRGERVPLTPIRTELKKRVQRVFEEEFPDAVVDVSSSDGNLHVVLVGKQFNRMTERDKQRLVWEAARRKLDEEALLRITRILVYGPKELQAVG